MVLNEELKGRGISNNVIHRSIGNGNINRISTIINEFCNSISDIELIKNIVVDII